MKETNKKSLELLLPKWVYQKLVGDWNQDGWKKYFLNTGWLLIAKVVSLAISFLTVAIVARYLGPENFGKLSYAQSFVAIFSAFTILGLDQILNRELVANPSKQNELLGTAFLIRLFFGSLVLLVTITSSFLINDEIIITWLIGVTALSFIFQPFGVISNLLNAKVLGKYLSYITIAIAFIVPLLKIIVIFSHKGILYFSAIIALEAFIYALFYLFFYKIILREKILSWTFSLKTCRSLLKDSWPLFLSSLSGYVYGRIDQVMIHEAINSTAVGIYDAAVRLTELLGFVPGVIIASVFPAVISAKMTNVFEYKKRLRALVFLCLTISFFSALFLFLISPLLVKILLGNDFLETINVLKIYVWSTIGTTAIILTQQFLIAENKAGFFLVLSVFGAVLNILLNYLMIPTFGIYGAAYATLVTMILVTIVFIIRKNKL